MMAPVESGKHRFPVEIRDFGAREPRNQKGFFTKRTQMIRDSDHEMTRFEMALCPVAAVPGPESVRSWPPEEAASFRRNDHGWGEVPAPSKDLPAGL
jgi:hypothetical protein